MLETKFSLSRSTPSLNIFGSKTFFSGTRANTHAHTGSLHTAASVPGLHLHKVSSILTHGQQACMHPGGLSTTAATLASLVDGSWTVSRRVRHARRESMEVGVVDAGGVGANCYAAPITRVVVVLAMPWLRSPEASYVASFARSS